MRLGRFTGLILGIGALLAMPANAELRPDQIALVINKNVPESRELAEFYAQARGIGAGRILELDLPFADEIPFDAYESKVQQPLREQLRQLNLDEQVTCLVTLFGVPLRIGARTSAPDEAAEVQHIRAELQRVQNRLEATVRDLERLAQQSDQSFRPISPQTADALARRADHATNSLRRAIAAASDAGKQQQLTQSLQRIGRFLTTPAGDIPSTNPTTAPADPNDSQPNPDPQQMKELAQSPNDPAARRALRRVARRSANPFAYEKLLHDQFILLSSEHSDSAIDNELALLWMDPYARVGWQPNPLRYPFINMPKPPRVLMVMRLDAPTPQLVRNMIADSIAVEREGLRGRIVIDSRGIAPRKPDGSSDAFGLFDQHLRDLATLVRSTTRIEMIADDQPDVLRPSEQQPIENVALYCGWYSVGQYVPGMKFARGAVAYHIASYEMTSLRDPNNQGWCRGLLNDGVASTLGPVAEPLLHAFPLPDDFFPLLMTGKLTLAEVYWRTAPLTSWKMSIIGDPLYTPFRAAPAMRVEDLPQRLKLLFSDAAPDPDQR